MPGSPTKKLRIAVLDLGTNTFHLLITDVFADKSRKTIFKSKMVVKLGEGGIHENIIAERPFKRGVRALKHYSDIINDYKADETYAFATSAIRSATNGKEFTDSVFNVTGIKIKVIKGEEEARLICLGVRDCVEMKDEPVLIMDIGGGSTEFIITDRNKIYARHSFNIGAARLLELFKPSDPIRTEQVLKVEKYLVGQLAVLDESMKKYQAKCLIGSSGSFDTFAEMIGYMFHNRNVLKNANSYKYELSEYCELHEILLHSTIAQRRKMKGLIKMRVDMIVLASICTRFVLHRYRINEMLLSKFALKEGALWEIINGIDFGKSMKDISIDKKAQLV